MRIVIIGSGNMGVQLSANLLYNNCEVLMIVGDINRSKEILSRIKHELQKRYSEQFTDEIKFEISADYKKIGKCDLVLETSKEDSDYKKEIISKLSECELGDTVIATNTSSISITELGQNYRNPEKFIGCHFFNPVSKMDLVEIVVGNDTSDETYHMVREFVKSIGKKPVRTTDSPGFIVNRLLLPQINESIRLLESGIATAEDIDLAVKIGLNHPMGPLELADFIGLDVCYAILEEMCDKTGNEQYQPAGLLSQFVSENKLGRKTGEGFYKYESR